MVDAQCSERCEATHGGSSPPPPTMKSFALVAELFVVNKGDLNRRKPARVRAEPGPEATAKQWTEGKSPPAHKENLAGSRIRSGMTSTSVPGIDDFEIDVFTGQIEGGRVIENESGKFFSKSLLKIKVDTLSFLLV